MATAYAALVSLIHVLNRVQHPTCPASFDESQIRSLFYKTSLLVDFLEAYFKSVSKDLELKIIDAAYAAQDEIESLVMVKIHGRGTEKLNQLCCEMLLSTDNGFLVQDLEKSIERMDLIIREAMEVKLKQKRGAKNHELPRSTMNGVSSEPTCETIKIIGFEGDLNRLLEQLATNKSSRQIVPVVGMGGIGKSTLAVSVYNHAYVRDNFHVKSWVTVSQVYNMESIFLSLLHDRGVHGVEQMGSERLGDQLHKSLFGRKYLIVLDDIWDIRAWEGISRFLPDNNNGSRVLLTTRLMNVALTVGSRNPYEMQLLDADKSWDLLSKKVFAQEVCPSELENCGRKIAKSCKGLPLAIVVIGGMLKMSDRTLRYWAYVAENIKSIISTGDDEYCFKILCLSYQELPIHLRPCFLYMATFPEDYEIRVSDVTMLWAADGFIKPNGHDTLEEIAIENLKNIINRNLITVKKLDSRGRMKRLIVHDIVRDLCIRQANMERFLYLDDGAVALECQRRFVLQRSGGVIFFPTTQQKRLVRSFISFGEWTRPPAMPLLSLLRVSSASCEGSTPKDIAQLANLRFIKSSDHEFFCYSRDWHFDRTASLASSISLLWNLETLIVGVPEEIERYSLPSEICELEHIKHLIFSSKVIFPDPPTVHIGSVLGNLQTLKKVVISSHKVLYRIPNIKDLGIECYTEELPPWFWKLVHCHKLEVLDLYGRISFNRDELNNVTLFPNSLKKLTLSGCLVPWDRMTIVGSLPNLEVLKLKPDAFVGEEWNSTEGEFQSLKVLSIADCYSLVNWRVENSSDFPRLEHLSIQSMRRLEGVPQVFGESMTLKSIRLKWCQSSVVISAKQIFDEQESMDYHDLTVEALFPWLDNKEQETELKSMTSDRFHIRMH